MNARAHPCQIFLAVEAGLGSTERLGAALGASSVASLLILNAVASASTQMLVEMAQSAGSAVLLADDAALAVKLRADGVHLSAEGDLLTRYHEARANLGKDSIIGVDCGGSRHLAMEAGEAGADYIAFSKARVILPTLAEEENENQNEPGLMTGFSTAELVQWWSEIFEVPCVALDADGEPEQRQFVEAGADFLGLVLPSGQSLHVAADMIRSAADLIARTKTRS